MAVIKNVVNCDVCRKTCGNATNMFKYAAKKKNKKENLRTDESRREKASKPSGTETQFRGSQITGAQSRRIKVCVKLIW